jgi:hypothetical protein
MLIKYSPHTIIILCVWWNLAGGKVLGVIMRAIVEVMVRRGAALYVPIIQM